MMVTVTFGMAAPDGSVTTPAKAAVPADCAIKVEADVASSINSEATASHALSGLLNLIFDLLKTSKPVMRCGSGTAGFCEDPGSAYDTRNCLITYYTPLSVQTASSL